MLKCMRDVLYSERDSEYVSARGWQESNDDGDDDDDEHERVISSPEDRAIVNQIFEKTLEEYDDEDIGDVEDVSRRPIA